MDPVWKKLQLKDQPSVHLVDAPDDLRPVLTDVGDGVAVTEGHPVPDGAPVVLAFATTQAQVDRFAAEVAAAVPGDGLVWVAYPKGSSKRYTCKFNRDTGWGSFGEAGFEPVRQVAVDADWSALRFRRVEHIAKLTRKSAISAGGRARIQPAGGG